MTSNTIDQTEAEFLVEYAKKGYPDICYTADTVLFTRVRGVLSVLLIERGGHPSKGMWALPGGFIDGEESGAEGAARELMEETGVSVHPDELIEVGEFYEQGRDPRGNMISTAFIALVDKVRPVAGDDAKNVAIFSVELVLSGRIPIAFDHLNIINSALSADPESILRFSVGR